MPTSKWTRLLLVLVALLSVAMITIMVLGNRLPETQSAHGQLELALKPEDVWKRLTDVKAYPRSALSAVSVEELEATDERPNWREHLSGSTQTWTTSTWTPFTEMVNDGTDSKVSLTTSWKFMLEPTTTGTKLDMIVSTTVAEGSWHVPFFRFILSVGGTRVGARSYLQQTFTDLDPKSISWIESSSD